MVGHIGYESVEAGRPHAGVVEEVGLVAADSVAAGAVGGVEALQTERVAGNTIGNEGLDVGAIIGAIDDISKTVHGGVDVGGLGACTVAEVVCVVEDESDIALGAGGGRGAG